MRVKAARKIALSAGIIPVRRTNEGIRYLLLRVYNYWDFPKGLVAAGESPLDAALRELHEETSLKDVKFTWGQEYRETEPYSYGKIARYYLGEVPSGEVSLLINPALGNPEHHEFRWCSYEEALTLMSPRVKAILEWAQARVA